MGTVFWVDEVRGQGRLRFTKNGHRYTLNEDTAYREAIVAAYKAAHGAYYGTAPVAVAISIHKPLPTSTPKRIESDYGTIKPDVDNVAKIVCDALNKVAYADDKQVVRLSVSKERRVRGCDCGILVMVYGLEEVNHAQC